MAEIDINPNVGGLSRLGRPGGVGGAERSGPGGKFGQVLKASIAEASRLQADADKAINALNTGKTDNLAEVMTAVRKAELAFKMLLQIRNKLLGAYDEVRQMRM